MISYQSMQVQCLQESVRNRNESCSIYLRDIVLDDNLTEDDLTTLKTVIHLFNSNVKSLGLKSSKKIGAVMKSMNPGVFTSLQTLKVDWEKETVWLAKILIVNARKLTSLAVAGCDYCERLSLSDINITALTGLTCLQSLNLWDVNMNHSNMKRLYAYISQTTTLTFLTLAWMHCFDHKDQRHEDCDVTLDLHCLYELKALYLHPVPCRELHVKPTNLEKFEFVPHKVMTDRASASLWEDLRTAPVLTSLGLGRMPSSQKNQINNKLTQLQHQLQYLKLAYIDMGDVTPRFSPEMTKLEHVTLVLIKLSPAAWRTLFHSVGQLPRSFTVTLKWIIMTSQEWRELLLSVGDMPHVLKVELDECRGPFKEEWKTIVDVIKSISTISLLQDLSIDNDGDASLTLRKQ